MTDEEKLQVAIAQAEAGQRAGNDPYGAALFDGDTLIAAAHNRVATTVDPVAHAEIEVLRAAFGSTDPAVLARSVLYASCEPCAMCIGAIRWAGIGEVVYAARDAEYGGAASDAPGLPHPRTRQVPQAAADALLRLAKARWEHRDPRTLRRG